MTNQPTQIFDGNAESGINLAIQNLRNNLLIGLPTETVYGLAALASSRLAIAKIFKVKERPTNHPLILHLANYADLDKWTVNVPEYARTLCNAIWPGPLTVILQRSKNVCDEITGFRETVAVRVPNHRVALKLLRELDDGLVAPSANRFGKVSPTTAQHVVDDLGSDVSLVLDGGVCSVGVESTILDCTLSTPQILRYGAVTTEQIKSICEIDIDLSTGESRASGMLEKHYAPKCRVELAETSDLAQTIFNSLIQNGLTASVLDYSSDVVFYAQELYASLRLADSLNIDVVVAVMPPNYGLGVAIRDRLTKASTATH